MRVRSFRIENFRNIRLAECTDPPNFIVICGGNGCGKSALLEAIMTAKEHAGAYGTFNFDKRAVSADADTGRVSLCLDFTKHEREFLQKHYNLECPEQDDVVIDILPAGRGRPVKTSKPVSKLLSSYSTEYLHSPGFFDFIDPHRQPRKVDLSNWNTEVLSDEQTKKALSAAGTQKFQNTKMYLAGLKMHDLQQIQSAQQTGNTAEPDSLKPIRDFFNRFFSPMEFADVHINKSPFEFIIRTPRGVIDIDDLSSGEKEVLNTFVHFHQLNPQGAVILFDEVDAHLHPDLQRRYLEVLRDMTRNNQLWVTTHSPEMMIAAGSESLFTVLKEPPSGGGNQFVRVTGSDHLHSVLSEVMGSRGLVSFNQRIVFIEGQDTSADRAIYEKFYPPGTYNVSFVPAGNSTTVTKIAERVNALLTASVAFQEYFCIVDGDMERAEDDPTHGARLFKLPVYHVENFLLDPERILKTTRQLLGTECPLKTVEAVEEQLKHLLHADKHLKSFAKAMLDARIACLAKAVSDAVWQDAIQDISSRPNFETVEEEARQVLTTAWEKGEWKAKCKGRDLLKAYCHRHKMKYEHFRNSLIDQFEQPPEALAEIMNKILR